MLRWLATAGSALAGASFARPGPSFAIQQLAAGVTNRQARQAAIEDLPLEKLSKSDRERVTRVAEHASVFRRLPTQLIRCEPTLYLFLIEHPDVVVNIWNVLGMSEVSLQRTAKDKYRADDKSGTLGDAELVYRSHGEHVVYSRGTYEGNMFTRKVRGECVLSLVSEYSRETDGAYYVTCRMDAFVKIENIGIDLLSRTFQPLVGTVVDHNFRETAAFIESLSRTAEANPEGIAALAKRLNQVDAADRDTLARVCERAAREAAQVAEQRDATQRDRARR